MGNIKFGYRSRIYAWLPIGYPNSVLKNGIGRFVVQLQRLTFNFCRTSTDSVGVRSFIERDLMNFAEANPGIVIYLRPLQHRSPYLFGEYLNGRQASIHVSNQTQKEINRWVNYLRTRSGQQIVKFESLVHSEHPSIQGFWHPFLNLPTDRNILKYPDEEASRFVPTDLTATEQLLDMVVKNGLPNVRVADDSA